MAAHTGFCKVKRFTSVEEARKNGEVHPDGSGPQASAQRHQQQLKRRLAEAQEASSWRASSAGHQHLSLNGHQFTEAASH